MSAVPAQLQSGLLHLIAAKLIDLMSRALCCRASSKLDQQVHSGGYSQTKE